MFPHQNGNYNNSRNKWNINHINKNIKLLNFSGNGSVEVGKEVSHIVINFFNKQII